MARPFAFAFALLALLAPSSALAPLACNPGWTLFQNLEGREPRPTCVKFVTSSPISNAKQHGMCDRLCHSRATSVGTWPSLWPAVAVRARQEGLVCACCARPSQSCGRARRAQSALGVCVF